MTLLGRGREAGVLDLSALGEEAALLQLPDKGLQHPLERPAVHQFVAKQPDRVLVRCASTQNGLFSLRPSA